MDEELSQAVERHEQEFGEFNATIMGLNLDNPETKSRILNAIATAIETGTPVNNAALGISPLPPGARV